jgi:hypothetical protein
MNWEYVMKKIVSFDEKYKNGKKHIGTYYSKYRGIHMEI